MVQHTHLNQVTEEQRDQIAALRLITRTLMYPKEHEPDVCVALSCLGNTHTPPFTG